MVLGLVSPEHLPLIVCLGTGASLVDSWIGAVAQAQYACAHCGTRSEMPGPCHGEARRLVGGVRWLGNELVNFSISFAATLLAAAPFALAGTST
jgi:uncharacterized membrane protein